MGDEVFLLDFNSVKWCSWNPGLLEQDLITLPIELGMVGGLYSFYTPTPHPLYPFKNEVSPLQRNKSQHPKEVLVPAGAVWALGTLSYLEFATERFPLSPIVRGWIHAHLVTEILTAAAKVSFQRPRPFYGRELESGRPLRNDDRFSFFSGHASHAFAFAGYSSAALLNRTHYSPGAFVYAAGAFSAASFVAHARVTGGQHNWSDVIVGGLVGLTSSILTYRRVEQVIEEYGLTPRAECPGGLCSTKQTQITLGPMLSKVDDRLLFGFNTTIAL
jgi:membrane-associated phospholipid phosphatase